MNAATKAPEYLLWSWTTIALCVSGWLTHWLWQWRKAWKEQSKSLIDFIDDNPPAFWMSVLAAASLYIIGPFALSFVGINLEAMPGATAAVVANGGAYAIGLLADFIVYRIAKTAGTDPDAEP